jgi:hypothetical protein
MKISEIEVSNPQFLSLLFQLSGTNFRKTVRGNEFL